MTAPDIFLSYNREDQAVAKRYADAFAAEGLNVWWDAHLRSGEAYDEVTEAALRGAKAVVVLWSKRSVVSRWVRAEATIADRCKTLVPVTIEACERPIMFELTQTADLCHWTGDAGDRAWQALLGDVRRFVGREVETPATVAEAHLPAPPTVQETLKPGQSGSAPSLAVLPFTNRSGRPEDEVFAEGMVEDIVWALSQGVNVRVLGATATANLNRAAITDLAALGRQLDVRYLLEGNVRRVGADLRVTTQLLETETGAAIWAAKFERPLAELAELQEDLVTEVAASLDTQVYSLEMERALKKPSDITAWEALARSMAAYRNWDAASLQLGIEESARAVAIAPDYAPGLASYAAALADHYFMGQDDPAEVQRIRSLAERALSLAPDNAQVLIWVGEALCFIGYPEEGERLTARAVRKAPGGGFLHLVHSTACLMVNRPEQSLAHANTAERLMPGSHLMWAVKLSQLRALFTLGRWAEASEAAAGALLNDPTSAEAHFLQAFCLVQLEQIADAHRCIQAARQLRAEPEQLRNFWRRLWPNGATAEKLTTTVQALWTTSEGTA
jgi:TolB-like protein